MTEDVEKIFKGITEYTEQKLKTCRNCRRSRQDPPCGGPLYTCTIGGVLGDYPVHGDATCRMFEAVP